MSDVQASVDYLAHVQANALQHVARTGTSAAAEAVSAANAERVVAWLPPPNPPSLSYQPDAVVLTEDAEADDLVPSVVSAIPVTFAVAPALPDGLSLDTDTGIISGTPTVAAAQAVYRVTATNAKGSTSRDVVLTVLPEPEP